MTLATLTRSLHRHYLFLSVFVLVALSAYPQTTLTGAIQFSTDSTGTPSDGPQAWNTLGGDNTWNLWLALNPDATSPINGPSSAQASISVPLEAGNTYRYYIFGQPSTGFSFNGLNLFFDGDNSNPGISVFGHINSPAFVPNGSSTLTIQENPVPGAGTTAHSADGVVAVLTGYEWHTPQTPPGDVCQPQLFAPGDGPDFFGSFTLQVSPAATFSLSQPSGSPGTKLTLTGSGFTPLETVTIYAGHLGLLRFATTVTDASGSFTVTSSEPQHPYGPMDVFALGQTSGKLGFATFFVAPAMIVNPGSGLPGGTTAADGLGFGAGEMVSVYWDNPRQLLGTVTANSQGSFLGSGALTITILADASPGLNAVIGIGQTTAAIGLGEILVK